MPIPLGNFLMIYICLGTDILASFALIYEKAETNLMDRKPRNIEKEKLTNARLFIDAYLFKGMIESFVAFFCFFHYMYNYANISPGQLIFAFNNWQDGYLGYTIDELNTILYTGQTIYFITLVIMQFGNLHATRTRFMSILQHNPLSEKTRNYKIYYSILGSLSLALIVIYIPTEGGILQTNPPPAEYWFIPIGFSIFLVLCDETRKYIVRNYPKSIIARLAW